MSSLIHVYPSGSCFLVFVCYLPVNSRESHRPGKDIIVRLLDKEENTRLGSKSGASEVKQAKWFAKINWGLLRNTQPPVR